MLIIYALGLWINISAQNIVRHQSVEYTYSQLAHLVNNFDQEIERLFRQQVMLSNDSSLNLLLLYTDTTEMGSVFNHLHRISTHLSAIYMSSVHVNDVGVYLPKMSRITRHDILFSPLSTEDRAFMDVLLYGGNGRQIILYEQDLVIRLPLSSTFITQFDPESAISYIRISGESIRRTLEQMAFAYNMDIALYNGGEAILATDVHMENGQFDFSALLASGDDSYIWRNLDGMWVLHAPFSLWNLDLIALLFNTQVDSTVIPTLFTTFVFFSISLIGSTIVFTIYISRLSKQIHIEQRISENAKLRHLHLQITPHFLYNSFYHIYRLSKLEDMDTIAEISIKLSQFYQYITRSRDDSALLALEFKHAEDYAKIQSIRYGERVKCNFATVPDSCCNISVPKLFLQPLIENAYVHALEGACGTLTAIRTSVFHRKGRILISVEDDGTGLDDAVIAKLKHDFTEENTHGEITSLQNINQRLALMYGDKAYMDASRSDMGGLRIDITISC